MSEEKLTSNKLDIELKRQSLKNSEDKNESYKPISEDINLDHVSGDTVKNSNMVRENTENAQDGADEKMLGSDDKETLALKDVEVKFIAATDSNGDAKIEIENAEKTFTGMTKEELMKYANDPFWVKLRWFLFILFWAAWIGMLVGAIMIILNAPKCAAPTPLPWYKEGPLVTIDDSVSDEDIEKFVKHEVQGVIYELDGDETYLVDTDAVQERIKKMVEKYNAKNIHVVIDLTPNYITKEDELFKKALGKEPESLGAFVTSDKALNWKKVSGEGSAFELKENKYFLKQFGDHYDIRLDHPVAKEKFKSVLTKLADIGVKGFRLANAKHFIVKESGLEDEKPATPTKLGTNLDQYEFYEHQQSTYLAGLGQLLHEFNRFVSNVTNNEGFFTIKDDLSSHVEKYAVEESLGFELPRYGFINSLLHNPDASKAKSLKDGFDSIKNHVSSSNWMQIEYTPKAYANFDDAAFKLFIGLLNGVQISSFKDLVYIGDSADIYTKLQKEHKSPVYQHGNFEYYLSADGNAFAYSRMKSGNPGYFVVINPSNNTVYASFNETSELGSELTYFLSSATTENSKANLHNITMPKYSTAIFTFVPK